MEKLTVFVYDKEGNLYQKITQLDEYSWLIYNAYEDILAQMGFSFDALIRYLEIVQKKHKCKVEIIEEV